jgi:ubiquinone/menaquinone biosynthesis C-methylase UbiE
MARYVSLPLRQCVILFGIRSFSHSLAMSTSATTKSASPNFDAFAQQYSENANRVTRLHATDLIEAVRPTVMRGDQRILEIGCGAGAFGLAYLDAFSNNDSAAGPPTTVYCTDLSPAMVRLAEDVILEKQGARSSTCSTQFVFKVADATNLEGFENESFDMVVSVFGIFLIPDRESTLSEVRRVLKPGGVLATTSWTTSEHNEALQKAGFGANLHDAAAAMKIMPKDTSPDDRPRSLLPQFVLDWFDRENVKAILTDQNRFGTVEVHRSLHTVVYGDVDHVWNSFTKSSPHFSEAAAQDEEQVRLAKEALAAVVAPDGDMDRKVCLFTASNLIVAS